MYPNEHRPGPWYIGSEHDDKGDYRADMEGWPFFVARKDDRVGYHDYHVAGDIQNQYDAKLISITPALWELVKAQVDNGHVSVRYLATVTGLTIEDLQDLGLKVDL